MVDPHTAAAGTGTLMTVAVFIGSQLSPSVMIRRAVKKELKASALLKDNGSIIDPIDAARLKNLKHNAERSKLTLEDTTWESVAKNPFKLLLRAHRYHGATDHYLLETRSASANAVANAALSSASQASPEIAANEEVLASASRTNPSTEGHAVGDIPPIELPGVSVETPTEQRTDVGTPPPERHTDVDTPATERHVRREISPTMGHVLPDSATAEPQYPTYHSTKHASQSYTTYFRNVTIAAGASANIILHFGVGDFTVTLNPHQEFPDLPALYCGPLVLSGYVMLVPCNPRPESTHKPDVLIGRGNKGYDIEFSGMRWDLPAGFHMSVSKVDDDRVSIASDRATVGEVPVEDDRLTPHYRAGRR